MRLDDTNLNSIKKVELQDIEFDFDEEIISGFDNAINAYFEPHIKPFSIELFWIKKYQNIF